MKKLHLGCGTKHLEGYTNIDIRYLPGVDEINNIRFLRNYKNNTVDEIYACHVLEHFGRWEYKDVLKRWFEILKPGGQLRLAVPDFSSICSYYIKTGDLKSIIGEFEFTPLEIGLKETISYFIKNYNSIRK